MTRDPARAVATARHLLRASARRGQEPVRARWRRWVYEEGVDDTVASSGRSTLVVAPHPDDETIGCGATIARKRALGTPVEVVVVCDGRHSHTSAQIGPAELARIRQAESVAACGLLGVDAGHVRNLGFEELTLWRCLDAVAERLADVIHTTAADEILVVAAEDWHTDHRAVHAALVMAVDRARYRGLVGAYPVWFWADGPWRSEPVLSLGQTWRPLLTDPIAARRMPTARLVRADGFTEVKRRAFATYRSQTTNLTGEPGWQTFPAGWLEPFCGPYEVFFPVEVNMGGGKVGDRSVDASATSGRAAPVASGPFLDAVLDHFEDDRLAGTVIGTRATSGAYRHGVDAEGVISVDNGAARFAPLDLPGWGRQGIAYGPFRRAPGLAMATSLLNGHNTAQSNVLDEGRRALLARTVRHFPSASLRPEFLVDNLAVGFFDRATPADARCGGNALVMHAGGALNGELRARVGGSDLRAHLGVQEVPITYLVVLRERGAMYFASSLPGAAGLAGHPLMRPVAIDHHGDDPVVFAGVHQAVHGEVFHQIASRLHQVQVTRLPGFERWCGPALLADRFAGTGELDGAAPEVGSGVWRVEEGTVVAGDGARGESARAVVTNAAGQPVGLVHVCVETGPIFAEDGLIGLVWRLAGGGGFRVQIGPDRAVLEVADGDDEVDGRPAWRLLAEGPARVEAARRYSLQVLDDGARFGVHLDGRLLFDRWFDDDRWAEAGGVGFLTGPADRSAVRSFEAHPRAVPLPAQVDIGPPWHEQGTVEVVHERFDGAPGELGQDDAGGPEPATPGHASERGPAHDAPAWARSFGHGRFVRSGRGSLLVDASTGRPNPGRTIYTTGWPDPGFADIQVTMVPPGGGRGEGEAGRGGLAFWQDPGTYVVLNMWLDDWEGHDGSSISMFFSADGHDRLYDAVWTNVGRRVVWGQPFTLRASCDGRRLLAWLDGEPVLARALRDIYPQVAPMRLRRVGLAANWEWGDDTGTEFRDFIARGRPRPD